VRAFVKKVSTPQPDSDLWVESWHVHCVYPEAHHVAVCFSNETAQLLARALRSYGGREVENRLRFSGRTVRKTEPR